MGTGKKKGKKDAQKVLRQEVTFEEPVKRYSCPDLLFLAFLESSKENHQKARISSACRTPKFLGKEGENAQNRKGFLEKGKGEENQKGKEKKIRVEGHPNRILGFSDLSPPFNQMTSLKCIWRGAREQSETPI